MMLGHLTLRWDRAGPHSLSKGGGDLQAFLMFISNSNGY